MLPRAGVEQWDSERFDASLGTAEFPGDVQIVDDELRLPPKHTKTWYHTGAFDDQLPGDKTGAGDLPLLDDKPVGTFQKTPGSVYFP